MTYQSEVRTVKHLNVQIEKTEGETDRLKWERAERIAGLCLVATQERVAQDVGLSQKTVSVVSRLWQRYGSIPRGIRPRYAEADYEVQGRGGGFATSIDRVVTEVAKDPALASAIVESPKAHGAILAAEQKKAKPKKKLTATIAEPFAKVLTTLHISALSRDAEAMRSVVMDDFAGSYTWRPRELKRVLKELDQVAQDIADVRAVLTSEVEDGVPAEWTA